MIRSITCLVFLAALLSAPSSSPAQIDQPVRGKKYPLSSVNGPWMIMVTSFTLPPGVDRASDIEGGMTPEEAADELVFELRSHGVPAYSYTLGNKTETIETVDRLQEPEIREYTSQRKSVCVLAGNYKTINPKDGDSQVATQTLQWIKHYRPKVLRTERPTAFVMYDYSGVVRGAGQRPRLPLKGAFFTTNPLSKNKADPLNDSDRQETLARLNSGSEISLYQNRGKYTMIVATFFGRSILSNNLDRHGDRFNKGFGETLNQAARDAWELATYLRQKDVEAYVWHDVSCSVVTVGTFDSLKDPDITKTKAEYGATLKADPETGQKKMTAQLLTSPRNPTPTNPVRKRWIFDPVPRLMKVPVR